MTTPPDIKPGGPARWDALDFWRGYLLCTIFINHVPGNAFEPLTQKNFGFSDSAEGFVFLSGISLALAFGRRWAVGEWAFVTRSLAKRCAKLYGMHVGLSLLGLMIFMAGASLFDRSSLLQAHGRDLAVSAPGTMLLGVLSLGHQFGYFNILPMYILMMAAAPPLLWLGRLRVPPAVNASLGAASRKGRADPADACPGALSPWPMVAASLALYVAAVARGWNLPTWPEPGTWFFDPFAWQFMMACGMAAGLAARRADLPRSPALAVLAGLVAAYGAFSVTDGFSLLPGLEGWTRAWAAIDKTTLGFGRVLHFLSIAYLVHMFRLSDRLRRLPLFGPVCAIGRHSLAMFAVLSLMAAAGQVLTAGLGHGVLTDVVMVASGLAALVLLARGLDRGRTAPAAVERRDRPDRRRRAAPLIQAVRRSA